jgi:hypothetical protein
LFCFSRSLIVLAPFPFGGLGTELLRVAIFPKYAEKGWGMPLPKSAVRPYPSTASLKLNPHRLGAFLVICNPIAKLQMGITAGRFSFGHGAQARENTDKNDSLAGTLSRVGSFTNRNRREQLLTNWLAH